MMFPVTPVRAAGSLLLIGGTLAAQVTERVNVGPLGVQANQLSTLPQRGDYVSGDGRYVAYMSFANNLVAGDTNAAWDIFLRDRLNGTTERISVNSAGQQGNGLCGLFGISISNDGRYVAFYSEANNLVAGDTNGAGDIFMRDRLLGTTERVSLGANGVQGNGRSRYPALNEDGRYIVFDSSATNLVPGDTNGVDDVFLRDRVSGTTEIISRNSSGTESNGHSAGPTISADARFVAFASAATNLVLGDTNGFADIFVKDRSTGNLERVNVSTLGMQSNNDCYAWSNISANGRYVVFASLATNLVFGDTNGQADVFMRDLQAGSTIRASTGPGGTQANGISISPSISASGRFVAFISGASNLIPGVPGGIFVRDLVDDTIDLASVSTSGTYSGGNFPSISADGRYVAFSSANTNLVPGDTNGFEDIFIHDRQASGFTSFCHPGQDGVIPCPCANPASGPARGCDNASSTGGASLAASGFAYLAIDSLVFTGSGENPSAASILVQGDASLPNGLVFGRGVRCAGGALKRMYVKTASGGSITAPDLAAGDPTVSARSALLGDTIRPGQSRYYLVYYRDPTLLGGCPASSTFNTTQTGSVSWWP
jgi:Tol biopolymer transport system component